MIAIFIDGQNISPKYAQQILEIANTYSPISKIFVFAKHNSVWFEQYTILDIQTIGTNVNCDDILSSILLSYAMKNKSENIMLVSNDGDFVKTIKQLKRKRLICLGTNISKKLQMACGKSYTLF